MNIILTRWKSLLILVLLVVAMGTIPVASAQQNSQGQQDLLPLHIEVGPLTLLRMPSWVALSEGIYKKNGLNVDQCHTPITLTELKALGIDPPKDMYICPDRGDGGPLSANAIPGFLGNTVRDPITMGGGHPNVINQVLYPDQPRRVIILSTSNVTGWPIYVRKGITSPLQIKGGRIGVLAPTDIHGFMALVFAEAMGWDSKTDITLVNISGPPAFEALQRGDLDAMVAVDSAQLLAMKAGYKPLVDLAQWKVPMASASANADVEWLKNNRETARRFVKSQIEARAVMENDRGAFNRALVKYFNITDPKMQDLLYSTLDTLPRKPYPAIDGIKKAMKLYDSIYPQFRTHRAEEFIDESLVREFDQSGYIDSLYSNK